MCFTLGLAVGVVDVDVHGPVSVCVCVYLVCVSLGVYCMCVYLCVCVPCVCVSGCVPVHTACADSLCWCSTEAPSAREAVQGLRAPLFLHYPESRL